MIGVQEAIDLLPLPADIPAKREVHGGRDGTCRPDGQSVDVTALEERAHAGSDPGSRSQIDEPPATPMAPRADRMAEATIIHVTSLPGDGISADYRFISGVVTDPCRHPSTVSLLGGPSGATLSFGRDLSVVRDHLSSAP